MLELRSELNWHDWNMAEMRLMVVIKVCQILILGSFPQQPSFYFFPAVLGYLIILMFPLDDEGGQRISLVCRGLTISQTWRSQSLIHQESQHF